MNSAGICMGRKYCFGFSLLCDLVFTNNVSKETLVNYN